MATWFASDNNYGHEAIIRYCGWPYKNAADMKFDMARRWNERVGSGDTVYHLGDFAMDDMDDPETYPAYRRRLNGRIVLVRGNHEDRMEYVMPEMGFAEILESAIVTVDGRRLWLNQYPLDVPDYRGRPYARPKAPGPYDLVLRGHVHQQFRTHGENVNVGVDFLGVAPISPDEILEACNPARDGRTLAGRDA